MKKIFALLALYFITTSTIQAQCDINNFLGVLPIPLSAYPYTNAAGVTVSASVVNVNPLVNFTYNCNGVPFAGSNPAWWINSSTGVITLTFSAPVCNLTVLVNGTNTTEEFYFNANNGFPTITSYCSVGFSIVPPGNGLLCFSTPTGATGTTITVDNPAGATQYQITHNGLGSGSRVTLLDCYVPCSIIAPTHTVTCVPAKLSYCAGENTTISYTASGTFNAGNVFTAQLSNATGSFASPVNIGTSVSTSSGVINCTIPPGTPFGTGYRVRVNGSNPLVNGVNNGTDITIHPLPNVLAYATPGSVCQGGSIVLSGSGATTYSWTGGASNGVPFVPAATATYTVTGTGSGGCTSTSSIAVPVNPLPVVTASASPSATICQGKPVTLNGGGASVYTWSGGVLNGSPFSPPVSGTYTVTGTDANNCSATSQISLTVNPLPNIQINSSPSDTVCQGSSVTLTASGAVSYVWAPAITNGSPFVPTNTTIYTVTGTDANTCSATNSRLVVVKPMPVVQLGADKEFCKGDSLQVSAFNPGATYLWSNGSTLSTFTIYHTGLYWVDVNLDGCHVKDTIQIIVNNLPPADLGLDTAICDGSSIMLDATCPGCTYQWNNGSTAASQVINTEGYYSVLVTQNDCQRGDTMFLDVLPMPVVDLGPDTTMCPGDEIKLDAYQFGAKYLWSDQSTLSSLLIHDIGVYSVQVSLGPCTSQDVIQVSYASTCNCPVYLPTAFSPNNDGLNDEFRLLSADKVNVELFAIYNRFGQEVFRSTSSQVGWRGTVKGQPADVGTYYYFVKYTCQYTGKENTLKGDVTLLR